MSIFLGRTTKNIGPTFENRKFMGPDELFDNLDFLNPENEEDRKTLYKFIALFTFYILIVLIYFTYREYHYRQHLNKLNKEVNQAIYGENYEELHLTYFDNSSKWYRTGLHTYQ